MKVHEAMSIATDGTVHGKGATIRWVISKEHGAPNFAMRIVEVEPRGNTPDHNHASEHEVYILEGEGMLTGNSGNLLLKPGDVAFVEPSEQHSFINTGDSPLRFICVVPLPKE